MGWLGKEGAYNNKIIEEFYYGTRKNQITYTAYYDQNYACMRVIEISHGNKYLKKSHSVIQYIICLPCFSGRRELFICFRNCQFCGTNWPDNKHRHGY